MHERPRLRLLLPVLVFLAVAAARAPVARVHVDTWGVYEVHSGTIAQAYLDGLDVDAARLPIMAHVRGSAFLGFLLIPIYAVMGASAFAMKMAPLLLHAASIALLAYVLDRFFSRRAALTAALLAVFAPPGTAKLSVLGYGSHMEAALLVMAAFIPFLAITLEKRREAWRYVAFGLVVGLCHTWHLQALLSALVLSSLLLVADFRHMLPKGLLLVLLGVVAGVAPSFLFTGLGDLGGSWDLLMLKLFGVGGDGAAAPVELAAHGPVQGIGAKLAVLVQGGFVQFFELFESPVGGAWLGRMYALLILAGGALALWQDRERFAGLFARVFRWKGRDVSPAAYFPLHAMALLAVLMHGTTKINFVELSSGHPNRRFSPLLFSLTVLAVLGMTGALRKDRPTPRWLWLGMLVPMCLAGALGLVGTLDRPEARRLQNRGEAYEWFTLHLGHHVGGDMSQAVTVIEEFDRGDARFRTLRYMLPYSRPRADDAETFERERQKRAAMAPEEALYRATHYGRLLGDDPTRLTRPGLWSEIEALPPAEQAALLHGIGLGIKPPRPDYPAQWERRFPFIRSLFGRVPDAQVEAIAEGYGFAQGFPYDPYVEAHVKLAGDYGELPARARSGFYRGMGWGYRQRYLEPPGAVPEGLAILDRVPAENREDFLDGYLARRLPGEAAVLSAPR